MRRLLGIAAVVALAAAAIPGASAGAPECGWPMYGQNPQNTFRQDAVCTTITPLNASTLHVKWAFPTSSPITASPSVVDGVVYVGAWNGLFYALAADPAPGPVTPLWTFQITDANKVAFGRIVSSAAVADVAGTRVVAFGGGSTIYVLDAATGAKLADLCLDPRSDPAVRCKGSSADIEIESSPAIVTVGAETWIVVGHSVHNRAGIGRTGVVAMRVNPGATWSLTPLWKFDPETELVYTPDASKDGVPGFVHTTTPLTHGAGTGLGCGGVWSSPAVDVQTDSVVFGTASCTTTNAPGNESVFGVALSTGKMRWRYSPRVERGESTRFDDDFGASSQMLPGGLVGSPGKDGWYYAHDRVTGVKRWNTHVGQAGHLTNDFAIGGMIGTPAVGEVFDEPAVFITTAISTPFWAPLDSGSFGSVPDASLAQDPGRMFSLHAISAVDGRVIWRSPLSRQSYGAPTYARGVLFVPSTVGLSVQAFSADTGAMLWQHPLNGAPASAPAIVGDSIYLGTGTTQNGIPIDRLSGLWAFEAA